MVSRKLIYILLLSSLIGLLTAAWLAQQTRSDITQPDRVPPIALASESFAKPPQPEELSEHHEPVAAPEPLHIEIALPTPIEHPQFPPTTTPDTDWLSPYYGLTNADDIAVVDALLDLSATFDFTRFWHVVGPLADHGNAFAHYLTMTYREWLPLDDRLLRLAFVEEPYLRQQRAAQRSQNWLHWLFARWPAAETPSQTQRQAAFERALINDWAAQTLLISQPRWFAEVAHLDEQRHTLMQQLRQNPYIQLYLLLELSTHENPLHEALAESIQHSRHPLVQWTSQQLATPPPPNQNRAALLSLAQQGYLMALQEVRHIVIDGQGRWTTAEQTPISLNDALSVYQQQAAEQPRNPVISVALCELYLAQGDYQASWQFLRRFAYEDDYADEVEDVSCWHGNDDAYGALMVQRGVLTADAWQAHVDIINARRARIRLGER